MARPSRAAESLIKKAEAVSRKEHLNAKLDKKLKQRMKAYCALHDITMQDFLTEAIQAALVKGEAQAGSNDPSKTIENLRQ